MKRNTIYDQLLRATGYLVPHPQEKPMTSDPEAQMQDYFDRQGDKERLEMDEANGARVLANKILDRNYSDPDDDLAVLARQLLRADEMIARMKETFKSINRIASPNPERTFDGVIRDLDMITDIARAALRPSHEATAPFPQSEWKPIETAPKDGTRILLYAPRHLIMLGGWAGHGSYNGPTWYSNCVPIVPRPTKWMPTPELPGAT